MNAQKTRETRENWFENDKASLEWLNTLKKGTNNTYQTGWHYFLEFVSMTGDRILESRKTGHNYAWEKKVWGSKCG